MITRADSSHRNSIRKLWNIAFGEDKAFNDYFFDNIFDINNVLVYIRDNRLAAMTQAIEYEINSLGKFTYIYGAATHPDYRNKGIMTKLLNHSFEIDKQKGFAGSMLIPANKGLFEFYARIGYEPAFYIAKKFYSALDTPIERVMPDDWQLLNRIYEKSLENIPHPVRCEAYWRQQISMFTALGGYAYRTDDSYAFGWGGEKPEIQELMGENKDTAAGAVAYILGLAEIKASSIGNDTPLGVIKLYDSKKTNMYFNLMYN